MLLCGTCLTQRGASLIRARAITEHVFLFFWGGVTPLLHPPRRGKVAGRVILFGGRAVTLFLRNTPPGGGCLDDPPFFPFFSGPDPPPPRAGQSSLAPRAAALRHLSAFRQGVSLSIVTTTKPWYAFIFSFVSPHIYCFGMG